MRELGAPGRVASQEHRAQHPVAAPGGHEGGPDHLGAGSGLGLHQLAAVSPPHAVDHHRATLAGVPPAARPRTELHACAASCTPAAAQVNGRLGRAHAHCAATSMRTPHAVMPSGLCGPRPLLVGPPAGFAPLNGLAGWTALMRSSWLVAGGHGGAEQGRLCGVSSRLGDGVRSSAHQQAHPLHPVTPPSRGPSCPGQGGLPSGPTCT